MLSYCRSLANMLPAAVGATLVGAVAYCELLPQCFCCLSLLLTPLLHVCSCLGAFAARGESRSCRLERYIAEEEDARAPTLLW